MKPVMCNRRLRNCESSADRIRSITTIRSRPGRSSLTGACSMFNSHKPALLLCAGMIAAGGSLARAAEPGFYGYGDQPTPAQISVWNFDARDDDGVGLT